MAKKSYYSQLGNGKQKRITEKWASDPAPRVTLPKKGAKKKAK